MSAVLEKLAARQKAAEEAAAARKAKRTPEDAAELAAREAAEAAEAAEREERMRDRELELARRLDAALEKNPSKPLRVIDLEETAPGAGSYVVRPASEAAIKIFHKRTAEPNVDRAKLYRDIAADAVVDFNGAAEDVIDAATMHDTWRAFAMVPVTLGNAALELGGFVAETRKSGG